ncbi:hypothetical protein [Bacillus sp. CGMCC 1.16541]|uniref:hypothetical protein n=1 Tax=Bacillus sp. CGMCC 1.16541 TaxID=2185143 RepID=UPI000D73B7E8|nr:hypothetical protein [Bacillus sp. CGMCC 1.16541]
MLRPVIGCLALLMLVSCQKDKPKPETKELVMSSLSQHVEVIAPVNNRSMTVHQHVKGKSVFVECVIDDFSFTNQFDQNQEGQGFINVFVDNKLVNKVTQAAFTVRNLPVGQHTVKLELMKNEGENYGLVKEFTVHIQP